jgi:hypothetical protein
MFIGVLTSFFLPGVGCVDPPIPDPSLNMTRQPYTANTVIPIGETHGYACSYVDTYFLNDQSKVYDYLTCLSDGTWSPFTDQCVSGKIIYDIVLKIN